MFGCGDDSPPRDTGPGGDSASPRDTSVMGDSGRPPDAGPTGCSPAAGWTIEASPAVDGIGIATDATGTLYVVGMGASGLELHRRAADGTWMAPELSGLTPSWSGGSSYGVAVGPGGEVVVVGQGGELVYRDAAGAWSAEDLGSPAIGSSDPLFDAAGVAHVVRRGGGIQHARRAIGGPWEMEPLPGFPAVEVTSVGELGGALAICGSAALEMSCATRDGSGVWSGPSVVPTGVEVRSVTGAGQQWVIGNLIRDDDMRVFSTRTVLEPADPTWRGVGMDTSPTPDSDARLHHVARGPSGDLHVSQAVRDIDDPMSFHVRYVRFAADGSTTDADIACRADRPDMAVLTGDQPVVLFRGPDEMTGTRANFLAFGP